MLHMEVGVGVWVGGGHGETLQTSSGINIYNQQTTAASGLDDTYQVPV